MAVFQSCFSFSLLPPWFKDYATFKARKFESLFLFWKIITYLQNYHLHWIVGRTNILCKYSTNMFFQFQMWLLRFFFYAFPEAPASCDKKKKKNGNNFYCIVLLFARAQKACLRFLKSYFKLDVLMFLSFVISFLVDMFN